jgi:2-keto-4-pentenoate hydratase/2-oxohepta-3-ene-1,7-dioic acid hydratase in catechol pathway
MAFKRLVRFAIGDTVSFGDLINVTGGLYKVRRLSGDPFTKLLLTDEVVEVDKLLCPLEWTPLIILVGLNYQSHVNEAKLNVPKYPPIFVKPADALAGPFDTIDVHPDARTMLDYEGELTVVVGRDAKNISENEALDYVLGYTAGNDLSARNFQLPEASGMQFGYSKSFDQFGPIGHTIVAASEIPDPQDLRLLTRVNGQVKQQTSTSGMIWNVRQIISHLSRGMTLRKGTVIMTGTPAGVGFFKKEFLKDGDVVEVEIEGVASVRNSIRFP